MEDKEKIEQRNKKIRSAAYPSIGVEEAIQEAKKLRDNLGNGPYSRFAAAQALGYSGISGASAPRIAALVHFSLLDRLGNTYKQSQLADRILLPLSEDDKKTAIIEATKSPKIYKRLVEEYNGKSLPALLPNILHFNYKINQKVTKGLAKNFIKSLEFSGLLNNGVVSDQGKESNLITSEQGQVNVFSERSAKITGKAPLTGWIEMPLGEDIKISLSDKLNQNIIMGKYGAKFSEKLNELKQLVEEDSAEIPGTGKD